MITRYSKPIDVSAFRYSSGDPEYLESLQDKSDRIWARIMPLIGTWESMCCPCGAPVDAQVALHGGRYPRVKCLGCDHVYIPRVRSSKDVMDFYRESDEYNAHYFETTEQRAKIESIYRPKAEYVRGACDFYLDSASVDVLDVGAGAGYFLDACEWAKSRNAVEVGAFSRERIVDRYDWADGVFEDISAIGDRVFDVITAWVVIEHMPDPVAELRRLRHALRPGGILIVEVPRCDSISSRHMMGGGASYTWRHATADHLHLFSDNSLSACLGRAGFSRRLETWYFGLDAVTVLADAMAPLDSAGVAQEIIDRVRLCDSMVSISRR